MSETYLFVGGPAHGTLRAVRDGNRYTVVVPRPFDDWWMIVEEESDYWVPHGYDTVDYYKKTLATASRIFVLMSPGLKPPTLDDVLDAILISTHMGEKHPVSNNTERKW